MSGPYTVTITPGLLAEGEHKGRLEYLNFTAVSKTDTQKWSCVNTGTLDDFRVIFGDWDPSILERLRDGETVELPRTFKIDEVRLQDRRGQRLANIVEPTDSLDKTKQAERAMNQGHQTSVGDTLWMRL